MPQLVAIGIRAVVATPVWVFGRLAAVLVAATHDRFRNTPEDVEAMELLAVQAGLALENAQRFEEERKAKELLAAVSVRDELTGVGNRRHAVSLLDSLGADDAVVIIDLDHFKDVNDTLGHAAGDAVLIDLAGHLQRSVRDADLVARYGGEEFVVVLRGVGERAIAVADRIADEWRHSSPRTTFSAGVAVHSQGSSASLTMERSTPPT